MNPRIPKRYTLMIACTGRSPITLTFRPAAVLTTLAVVAAIPIVSVGKVFYNYTQRNHSLTEENSALAEQAKEILEQVEVLEAQIGDLQQRAGMDDSGADEPEMADPEIEGDRPLRPSVRQSNSSNFQGGLSQAVPPELMLQAAQAQIPGLLQKLQQRVQPALEKTLIREDARPKGIPLKGRGVEISSEFGLRRNPFGSGYELHQGMDFTAAYGTPIHVTAPGRVVTAGWSQGGYGYHVIVDHGYGYRTLYAHMTKVEVEAGEKIERDRLVGYLGSTGRSSGPHLHYGVYYNNQPIDPKDYLD
ncbi:peptidoglycan DD-metalloendopeptidase family protein [Thermoleptolyngbya sp.]